MSGDSLVLVAIVSLTVSLLVIVVLHEVYVHALAFVRALPTYTSLIVTDIRLWLASKIIGSAYEVVEAGGLAKATAVVLPEPTHFADITRMVKSLGLTMRNETDGVVFDKGLVSVFAIDNNGEYYLFNAKKIKWTKSTDVRVLTKLRDMVIYHPREVKVSNTNHEPEPLDVDSFRL